jgi:hypothetical protein
MPGRAARDDAASFKEEVRSGAEEIYVFRTVRVRRTAGATANCAAAPFPSATEDFYDLWSVDFNASNARVIDSHRKSVGGFTACLGQPTPGEPLKMYAMGIVGPLKWNGLGECNVMKSMPPARGIIPFNCVLELSGLPMEYAGGFGVSSTLAATLGKDGDATAHVPGYLSTSVVVIRVWRKPKDQASAKGNGVP